MKPSVMAFAAPQKEALLVGNVDSESDDTLNTDDSNFVSFRKVRSRTLTRGTLLIVALVVISIIAIVFIGIYVSIASRTKAAKGKPSNTSTTCSICVSSDCVAAAEGQLQRIVFRCFVYLRLG